MAVQKERRRRRRCPSCGGEKIVRGGPVQGVRIALTPPTELSEAVTAPAYADVCAECGMVTLYTRAQKD
jgi:hypothetical protein